MPYKNLEMRRQKERDRSQSRRTYICEWKRQNSDRVREKERQRRAKLHGLHGVQRGSLRTPATPRVSPIEARARLDAIKLASGCVDCGYHAHAIALDFDHLPERGAKQCGISRLVKDCSCWERIMAEVSKCEVVCANCHRVRSLKRRDFHKGAR
jgi:hypothetical protein